MDTSSSLFLHLKNLCLHSHSIPQLKKIPVSKSVLPLFICRFFLATNWKYMAYEQKTNSKYSHFEKSCLSNFKHFSIFFPRILKNLKPHNDELGYCSQRVCPWDEAHPGDEPVDPRDLVLDLDVPEPARDLALERQPPARGAPVVKLERPQAPARREKLAYAFDDNILFIDLTR